MKNSVTRMALGVALGLAIGLSSSFAPALAATPAAAAAPVKVLVSTSMGDITLELDAEKAPLSVKNFVAYANSGHYNGTVFHRVIETFMIQGGGFTTEMKEKPGNPPIKLESANGLKNTRGTVAMARTSVPDSATSQFFINTVDNEFLNYRKFDTETVVQTSRGPQTVAAGTVNDGYAVFGKVTAGMEVVDKIKAVKTGVKNRMPNVPEEAVVIKSVKILK